MFNFKSIEIMEDFTVIPNEKLSELKRLNNEIEALEEMQFTFGNLLIGESINLKQYKNQLSTLIKSL